MPTTHCPLPRAATSDSGRGALQDPAKPGEAVNASGGLAQGGGVCSSRTRRPGGPPCGCAWASKEAAAAHLQTACGRQRTRDRAGEGRNKTEENSEKPAPGHSWSPRPATSSSLSGRCVHTGEQAPGLGGPGLVRAVTCTRSCPPRPPEPSPPPGPSPSFTEMVGFFCRSPSRMKKSTRGMKISKAKTHWKGRAGGGHQPGETDALPEGRPGAHRWTQARPSGASSRGRRASVLVGLKRESHPRPPGQLLLPR